MAGATNPHVSKSSVVGFYWTVLFALTAVLLILGVVTSLVAGIVAALVFLPAVQLASSVVTLFWIGVRTAEPADRKADLLILGRITLWSILGTLLGVGAMIFGLKMLK